MTEKRSIEEEKFDFSKAACDCIFQIQSNKEPTYTGRWEFGQESENEFCVRQRI